MQKNGLLVKKQDQRPALVTERGPAGRKYNILSRVIDKKKFTLKINSEFNIYFTFYFSNNHKHLRRIHVPLNKTLHHESQFFPPNN